MRHRTLTLVGIAWLLAACVGSEADLPSALPASAVAPESIAPPSASASTATELDVLAVPTVEGRFPLGADGHELELRCYGSGTPTIVFEAGTDSSGIDSFPDALVRPLAETNQTCLYDRIGTGKSDAPAAERRTIDEVGADLEELLTAADVPGPYLLAGSSGGGNLAAWYASGHPADVAGLVLIDAGFDDPDVMAEEFPGEQAWAGAEHIDWLDGSRKLWEMELPIGDFPVLVLTADEGQGDPTQPSRWLLLSPNSREEVMHGGHDLAQEQPDEVVDAIRSVLDELGG